MIGKCFDIKNFSIFFSLSIRNFHPATYQNSFWIFVFRFLETLKKLHSRRNKNIKFFFRYVSSKKIRFSRRQFQLVSSQRWANSAWVMLGSSSYQFSNPPLSVHPREKLGDGCYSHWLNQSFSLQSKALYCPLNTLKKF